MSEHRRGQTEKLVTLNAALERWDIEPLYNTEVVPALSDEGLDEAVRQTEAELLRSVPKVTGQ